MVEFFKIQKIRTSLNYIFMIKDLLKEQIISSRVEADSPSITRIPGKNS